MFKLRFGLGWGFEPMLESPSSGPSEPRLGFECLFVLVSLMISLPHLRRRLCVCACIRRDMFSLSLSLSLTTTSLCLGISLYLLCASPLECLCKKTETGAKKDFPGGPTLQY